MLKAYYQISKYSKNNKLLNRGRKKISHSFVAAFVRLLYLNFYSVSFTVQNTAGNYITYSGANPIARVSAPTGSVYSVSVRNSGQALIGSSFGIMLGTGITPITTTDYKLGSLITHGTSTGQIEYLGHFIPKEVVTVGSNASFTIERLFLNSSGSGIVITEIGLYGTVYHAEYIHCLIRDLVSPEVTVGNGEYLKVTYTIQVTC
jgi:hypothetical protein